jgi:hypothetical protein
VSAPRDEHGHFVPLECPRVECGAGTLRPEGGGYWYCDGLADPGHENAELEACWFYHIDGEPRVKP